VDLQQFKIHLGKEPGENFVRLIEEQSAIISNLADIQSRIQNAEKSILKLNNDIDIIEGNIRTAETRRQKPDCGIVENATLLSQILYNRGKISYIQNQQTEPMQLLNEAQEEELECREELKNYNQLIDATRKELISARLDEIKLELNSSLRATSQQLVLDIERELEATDPIIDNIQKAELKKSRYQTRRFFKTSELLSYEATLLEEEAQIPKIQTAPTTQSSEENQLDTLIQGPIIESLSCSI
jgi:hypothetical protein